jgi:ankyrin repeat protein
LVRPMLARTQTSQRRHPARHGSYSGSSHIETIKLLIERGADINAPADTLGFTPFSGAIASGDVSVVRPLLAKGRTSIP